MLLSQGVRTSTNQVIPTNGSKAFFVLITFP